MGSCFSSSSSSGVAAAASLARHHKSNSTPPAYVVSVNGDLRHYSTPITASQVLDSETSSSSSSSSSTSSITSPTSSSSATLFFLCNSDSLYFDQFIPALRPKDQLDPSQIYFLLPLSKLRYKLSASDMAALAVKATLALQTATTSILLKPTNNPPPPPTTRSTRNHKHKRNPSRISPLLLVRHQHEDDHAQPPPPLLQHINNHTRNKHQTLLSSTPRPTVLQRLSSRRAKMAVRSFRIRLTTISEGSVLLFNP
ncbi:uncharacterized serine-rich protein C215.13 [Coffea eugenioides]|uniref:uncharacterized serine-rich protein C215.13 n=1 Tax=Coffea eugenioides TaxID=49369 RepID=UPI000F61225E|nr:uncharacterized serine-rich protein C215.13 [Coffea eugenioides]